MSGILVVGGGIGGLALALELRRRAIPCRVFEAAPEMRPVGVGVNLLPHATRILAGLGLEPASARATGPSRIEDVIGNAELKAISERYQRVSGYDRDALTRKEATP